VPARPSPACAAVPNDRVNCGYFADLHPAPDPVLLIACPSEFLTNGLEQAPEEEQVACADNLVSKVPLCNTGLSERRSPPALARKEIAAEIGSK
jgi:hypothetical protein